MTTPMSPGEALARFAPLKSCNSVAPLRKSKRQSSSRWRQDQGNWWVEEGKATIVTRSVSASAVPVTTLANSSFESASRLPRHGPVAPVYEHQLPRDRVTGWRPTVLTRDGYTAEQIAGFQLYEIKSRRLSSQEYGGRGIAPTHTFAEETVAHLDAYSDTAPESAPRIVELEADTPPISPPTTSQSKLEQYSCASPLHATPHQAISPLQFSPEASTISKRIPRKPVRSGIVPKTTRSKSDPFLAWPVEVSGASERSSRSHSPRKRKLDPEFEYHSPIETSQIYSPWDTHDPPPSPTMRPIDIRTIQRVRRPRMPVRLYSDSEFALKPVIESSTSRSRIDPKDAILSNEDEISLPTLLGLEDKLTPANIASIEEWGKWAIKVLLALYLAACIWNVLAAIKDAIVTALEPIFVLCGFLRWAFGK